MVIQLPRRPRLARSRLARLFRDLKIGRKLTVGFGCLVVITLLVVFLNFLAGQSALGRIQRTQDLRVPAVLSSTSAQENLLKMLSNIRAYLATGEPEYRYRYQLTRHQFESDLTQLEQLFADRATPTRNQLSTLAANYQTWAELPAQLISLQDNLFENQPALSLLDDEGQPRIIVIQREIGQMLDEQEGRSPSQTNLSLLRDMANFQSTFSLAAAALQSYLVTRDPTFRFEYDAQAVANQLVWERLNNNRAALSPAQVQELDAIAPQRDAFFTLPERLFAIAEGKIYRRDLYLFQSEAEPLAERMLAQLEAIVTDQQDTLARELRAGSRRLQLAQWQTLLGGLLAMGLGLALVRLLQRQIADPVKQLTVATSRVRAGDLTVKAPETSTDEVGELARSFNSMSSQLQKSFNDLRQSEATNRAIVTAIPDLMIQARRDGTYVDIVGSDRTHSTYGVKQFVPGRSVYDSLTPELGDLRMQHIEKALDTGDLQLYEQQVMIDGQTKYEEVRILVLADDQVLIMVRDITARRQNEKLKEENLRMGAELDVAQQIQQMILPRAEELNSIPGLDISGYMEPADEVGGDYYDVLQTDGVVTLGIGDVTGHGLESGLLMLMTQTAVRTLQEVREQDPVKFLDTLNRTIYRNVQRMDSDRNLTLAILNYVPGQVSISGQHEETLIVRADGSIERIDTMDLGLPIGLDDDIADFIDNTTVQLEPGDGVILYTDGIPEAYNLAKQQYGLERLCEVISQNWQGTAADVKQAIIDDVRCFIGEQKVFDDITLLVLKQQAAIEAVLKDC